MKLYEHREVLRMFDGLASSTLQRWCEDGLLSPQETGKGTGSRRRYNVRNLVEMGAIKELVSYRMPREFVKSVMKRLAEEELSEGNGFDAVIAMTRSFVSFSQPQFYIFGIRTCSRSRFAQEADSLVFGFRQITDDGQDGVWTRDPGTTSAVIVSLADIYEALKGKL